MTISSFESPGKNILDNYNSVPEYIGGWLNISSKVIVKGFQIIDSPDLRWAKVWGVHAKGIRPGELENVLRVR